MKPLHRKDRILDGSIPPPSQWWPDWYDYHLVTDRDDARDMHKARSHNVLKMMRALELDD